MLGILTNLATDSGSNLVTHSDFIWPPIPANLATQSDWAAQGDYFYFFLTLFVKIFIPFFLFVS